jgi:putative glutamine amidotransferase
VVRPRIGISTDFEQRPIRGLPVGHAFLCQWYVDALTAAGGLPWLIAPIAPAFAAEYIEHIDGLVLSGGDFDVDPSKFGQPPHQKLGRLIPERTELELALLAVAEARRLPVLGICGGMQLINVFRGGTLIQDLPTQRPSAIAHTQAGDKRLPAHDVNLVHGGLLEKIVGAETLAVNSTHHQAVDRLGRGLDREAEAPDGICEAVADRTLPFFLGVEWHPEAMIGDPRQQRIYEAFVAAAKKR